MTAQLSFDVARAARALAQVSSSVVAKRAGIDREALRSFEKGVGELTDEQHAGLRGALEYFGVVLIADEPGVAGAGVRKKLSQSTSARVDSWESEGGIVAEDDI